MIRGMHPLTGQRLDLWRLKNFEGTRLPSAEDTYLFHCVAPDNPDDQRLVALAEVRDVTPLRDAAGQVVAFPALERTARRVPGEPARASRPSVGPGGAWMPTASSCTLWPPIEVTAGGAGRLRPGDRTHDGGRRPGGDHGARPAPGPTGRRADARWRCPFSYRPGAGVGVTVGAPPDRAARDRWTSTPRRCGGRGLAARSTRTRSSRWSPEPVAASSSTTWTPTGRLVPVDRPPGHNRAAIVAGLVSTPSTRYPEGMVRVALLGDPPRRWARWPRRSARW